MKVCENSMSNISAKNVLARTNKPKYRRDKKKVADVDFVDKFNDEIVAFIQFLANNKKNKNEIKTYIKEHLQSFYSSNNVRHSYFRISAILQEIRSQKNNEAADTSLLETNLQVFFDEVIKDKEFQDINKQLYKFYDHCELEISRYSYFDSIFWKGDQAKEENDRLTDSIKKTGIDMEKLQEKAEELQKNIDTTKSEQITILSIFAAIMLAGLGSFAALGSALNKVDSISIYRFFACTAFIGLILFNVVTSLIYMVTRIINRNIYAVCTDCRDGDCINGSCSKTCNPVSRIRKRLPYIYWFNVLDVTVIAFSLSVEHIILKYSIADWVIILLAFIVCGIAIVFGLKNILQER